MDSDNDDDGHTGDGTSALDSDTEFGSDSKRMSSNDMEAEPPHTSTPIASHAQEATANGLTLYQDHSAQRDMASSLVGEANEALSSSPSRRLPCSTGGAEELRQTESLDTTPESLQFHTPAVDDSLAYFTASEDSTFVVENCSTVDLPSGNKEQEMPSVAHNMAVELGKERVCQADDDDGEQFTTDSFEAAHEEADAQRLTEDEHSADSDDVHLQAREAEAPNLRPQITSAPTLPSGDEALLGNQGEEAAPEELQANISDPDLRLLEVICEEATSMTIKEALIHSLNPSVRAGLQGGKLLLNETEVLSLERYCESVINNLITELLEQRWPQGSEPLHALDTEEKKEKALQLSEVGLTSLQKSCGRLARDIISESIGDMSAILADLGDASVELRVGYGSGGKSPQDSTMQELLVLFQNSEDVQQYIGDLTANVINSAINKVVISSTNTFGQESNWVNEHVTSWDVPMERATGQSPFAGESGSSEPSDSSGDDGLGGFGLHQDTAELDMGQTLEFDSDWDRGDVLSDLHSFAPAGKQKIIVRELSFDEQPEVAKIDLLAPVFLAVTEDSDEESELRGLRRKAQSIENLCGVVEERVAPLRRCRSSSIPTSRRAARRPRRVAKETEDNDTERAGETREELGPSPADEQPAGRAEDWRWYTVSVNSRDKVLDLDMLAPYMKVISHGGRTTTDRSTIVVISACYLPLRGQKNYDYLMEQLFFYVISTLELLATDEQYELVYFNASTALSRPAVTWMRRFYQQIERGLKKRMRAMYVVHPNFWLRTVIMFAKPFLSAHFWRKLHFVHALDKLSAFVPVDYIFIPDEVMRVDPHYRRLHNL